MERDFALSRNPSTALKSLFLLILATLAAEVCAQKTAAGIMSKLDRNGDGIISREEWRKKRIFDQVDLDGNGAISFYELQIRLGEKTPDPGSGIDMPDPVSISAVRRGRHDNVQDLKDRGLIETGLHPVWAEDVTCRGIDHWYAMDYSRLRPRQAYHGGVDIPAPFGTPVHAVMDGEVIAVYEGKRNPRGIEVVLRHTPEESGLPLYLYSRYTHFQRLPELEVGQRLKMGDVIGSTGNTGVLSCELKHEICRKSRRPVLHFDILYSGNEHYYDNGAMVIPYEAHWMDPNALFRKSMPVDSRTMAALPKQEKAVPISYMLENGELYPPDTRMIWPYTCHR
ncbi:MAG: peptidoglycan DD-metalloendopeptidase family protein [Candidatus Thiodiazotropha sp.]